MSYGLVISITSTRDSATCSGMLPIPVSLPLCRSWSSGALGTVPCTFFGRLWRCWCRGTPTTLRKAKVPTCFTLSLSLSLSRSLPLSLWLSFPPFVTLLSTCSPLLQARGPGRFLGAHVLRGDAPPGSGPKVLQNLSLTEGLKSSGCIGIGIGSWSSHTDVPRVNL